MLAERVEQAMATNRPLQGLVLDRIKPKSTTIRTAKKTRSPTRHCASLQPGNAHTRAILRDSRHVFANVHNHDRHSQVMLNRSPLDAGTQHPGRPRRQENPRDHRHSNVRGQLGALRRSNRATSRCLSSPQRSPRHPTTRNSRKKELALGKRTAATTIPAKGLGIQQDYGRRLYKETTKKKAKKTITKLQKVKRLKAPKKTKQRITVGSGLSCIQYGAQTLQLAKHELTKPRTATTKQSGSEAQV